MISLLHPTRRPQKSIETVNKWFTNYHGWHEKFEIIVSIDQDDPYIKDYNYSFNFPPYVSAQVIANKNRSVVDAINNAAREAKGDILIVVSDDTDCPEGWDTFLLKLVNGKTDWILKTQDGIQPYIITNPILDRTYYNRFGYIYNPRYLHMFCDLDITCVADLTGRKITSNILFKHNHYSVTKEPQDAISKRADSTWDQGEKLFLERYKRNFDLPPDQIKGKIQDSNMINWLLRKQRR